MSIELGGTADWRDNPTFDRVEDVAGTFATEEEAANCFDSIIEASGLFDVEHEVSSSSGRFRIDRLVYPNDVARQFGWTIGAVGVELKRGGIKIGPALCQALDYRDADFHSATNGLIRPSFVFVFPYMADASGAFQSVLLHKRIGGALPVRNGIRFRCGSRTVAYVDAGGWLEFGNVNFGLKQGSRSSRRWDE
jgi:hypothetical protein